MILDLTLKPNLTTDFFELSVVMPIYNESENIDFVLDQWIAKLNELNIKYQFILVNDGSKDNTLEKLCLIESRFTDSIVVINKPNSGHGRSIRLGYDYATSNCNNIESWVLQIDSDGQCSPEYFKEFWDKRFQFDYVMGFRKSRKDGFARLMTSKICMVLSSIIFRIKLPDPNVPYRLIKNSCLKRALAFIPQSFDIHNVALTTILASFKELKYKTVDIIFFDRIGGENSINFMNVFQLGFSMVFDLIKLNKSYKNKLNGE